MFHVEHIKPLELKFKENENREKKQIKDTHFHFFYNEMIESNLLLHLRQK